VITFSCDHPSPNTLPSTGNRRYSTSENCEDCWAHWNPGSERGITPKSLPSLGLRLLGLRSFRRLLCNRLAQRSGKIVESDARSSCEERICLQREQIAVGRAGFLPPSRVGIVPALPRPLLLSPSLLGGYRKRSKGSPTLRNAVRLTTALATPESSGFLPQRLRVGVLNVEGDGYRRDG